MKLRTTPAGTRGGHDPRRYPDLVLPEWVRESPGMWLLIPMIAGGDLLGFLTLQDPRTSVKVDWEVRDLLKTASRQAAGYLNQLMATEDMEEGLNAIMGKRKPVWKDK